MRPSCEDGKDFIRAVIARALDNPFPPAQAPISITQVRKAARQKKELAGKQAEGAARPTSPPVPTGPPRNRITQFVMNLPDTAILFLDAFRGVLSPANAGGRDLSGIYTEMPMVHCYCFTPKLETEGAEVEIRQVSGAFIGVVMSTF